MDAISNIDVSKALVATIIGVAILLYVLIVLLVRSAEEKIRNQDLWGAFESYVERTDREIQILRTSRHEVANRLSKMMGFIARTYDVPEDIFDDTGAFRRDHPGKG